MEEKSYQFALKASPKSSKFDIIRSMELQLKLMLLAMGNFSNRASVLGRASLCPSTLSNITRNSGTTIGGRGDSCPGRSRRGGAKQPHQLQNTKLK